MRTRLIIILSSFFFLITVPYLYAAYAAGPDYVFGGFLLNPLDSNTYLAKMYQGWRGDWRFTLPYTSDPGYGAYLFLFYITLGHISRILNLSTIYVFHIARLLSAGLMVRILYQFLKEFVHPTNFLTVYALALLGLGLGWLVFPFGVITSDMWVAEAYPFLSAYANPHFPLALSIMLFILLISYRVSIHKSAAFFRLGVITAILSFLLAIVLPFGVVLVLLILVSILIIELIKHFIGDRSRTDVNNLSSHEISARSWFSQPINGLIKQSFWVALGGIPLVLYDLYVVWTDPVLAIWNAQNITPSPPVWDLILSFSPVLIATCVGFWYLVQIKEHKQQLFLLWAVVGLLFLVLPFGLQRRFMMGIYVPFVGLAAVSFLWLNRKYSQSRANRISGWLLIISLPTILVLLLVANFGIQSHAPVYYLTNGEYQAMQWIENNTPMNALILAAPETGIYIPAHTGRRVIYGHPFETVNAAREEAVVEAFFADHEALDRQAFIQTRQVDFIFYGPREQTLGTLPEIGSLQQVNDQYGVSIYMVIPSIGMLRP